MHCSVSLPVWYWCAVKKLLTHSHPLYHLVSLKVNRCTMWHQSTDFAALAAVLYIIIAGRPCTAASEVNILTVSYMQALGHSSWQLCLASCWWLCLECSTFIDMALSTQLPFCFMPSPRVSAVASNVYSVYSLECGTYIFYVNISKYWLVFK